MEKVTHFTKANLKSVRQKIQKILDELGCELDMKIKMGNISYSSHSFRTPVEVSILNGVTEEDLERRDFEEKCFLFDLKKEDFGREFKAHGNCYVIVGIAYRSHKYPVIAKNKLTGKRYKFTVKSVQN